MKIRGYRIELGEIEATLRAHPQVKEAVVMAREDGARRAAAGWICTVRYEGIPSAQELRAHLKERLPEYMVPAVFVLLERCR